MKMQRGMCIVTTMVVALTHVAAPRSGHCQPAAALGGLEIRTGVAFPDRANAAAAFLAEIDLGYFGPTGLRALVGLSRFNAGIDRGVEGDEGSYRATGSWLGARYDLMPLREISPYIRAGLTYQRVTADATDPDVAALLEGSYVGVGAAVGARYLLDRRGRFGLTGEIGRTFINNIGNTAIAFAIRMQPRGLRSYRRGALDPRARPAAVPPPHVPPAAPARPAAPVAEAPRERIATLDELRRAEEERERTEAARLAEARAAAERAAAAAAAAERAEEEARLRRAAASGAMLRQGLTRAVAVMSPGARFEEFEHEFRLTISGGAFAPGSGALARPTRDQLRVLATVLAGYPGHVVTVEGHADATGDPAINERLSAERAASVRAGLIAEGVDPLWVAARGFGSRSPIASNATAAGRAANRRVEIRIQKWQCTALPVTDTEGRLTCPR